MFYFIRPLAVVAIILASTAAVSAQAPKDKDKVAKKGGAKMGVKMMAHAKFTKAAKQGAPDRLDMDWRPINFDGDVPVGSGWMHLTLFSDGTYQYSGHLHDSGIPSYDAVTVVLVKDAKGQGYSFSAKVHMAGTFEPGSREGDWNINGKNQAIANAWGDIRNGTWAASSHTGIDFGPWIDQLKGALQIVGAVASIVG